MTVAHPFAKPARLMRDFSGQVAISIAASAVAAAFFAHPEGLLPSLGQTEPPAVVWSAPMTPDGKFAMRHDAQLQQARFETGGAGPATPAALAMPLAIEWTVPEPEVAVAARPALQPQRVGHVVAAPPVKRIVTAERARLEPKSEPARLEFAKAGPIGQPLVITPAAFSDEADQPRPPGLIGRVVSAPAARAAGLVTGAAGAVGAAGSWTVAQATSLLPRW